MTLRQELSLLFGGLLVLCLSTVVGLSFNTVQSSMEETLTEQFSPQPLTNAIKAEGRLLAERVRSLEALESFRRARRRFLQIFRPGDDLLDIKGKLKLLKEVHSNRSHPERILLGSICDTLTESFKDVVPPHDMVALIDGEGPIIVELVGVSFEQFSQNQEFGAPSADTATDSLLWKWAVFGQAANTHGALIYPNGKPYVYGATAFFTSSGIEAVAFLGTEIDRQFLQENAGGPAFVVLGDTVVGTSDDVEAMGRVMVRSFDRDSPPLQYIDNSGTTYLVKSAPLRPFHEVLGENDPGVSGHVFVLQDLAVVKAAAYTQAQQSLMVGLAALVSALLLVPVVARRFTGPIGALSSAMKRVGDGALEQIPSSSISSIREVKEASLSFNEMVVGLRQKKALEAFVPEGTRQEVEKSGGEMPLLGGQRLERTIMFSDLRGFTSMSERLPATQVMEIINIYLHAMSREIRKEGGDINEYIGDAILAVFADPDAAVRAARKMTAALDKLHQDAQTDDIKGLRQGIGLHTGTLVEGNIGEAGERLKRAVVGDTVNLAARIQDRSREGRFTCIFLSGDTKEKLTEEFDLAFFGDEDFKGKAEPIPVWEVRS